MEAPSCITPSIFTDCFELCAGAITGAAPGPVCGWTFSEAFGVLGGTITFIPGGMSFDTTNAAEFPGDTKPLPAPLASVNNLSGQFDFTEYATVPNPLTTYDLLINNQDLSETIVLGMFGDGSLLFQVGDPASASNYSGTWMPVAGASHEVHFNVSAGGVPTLWIDGVLIPLLFIGMGASFASLLPVNMVSFFIGSGDPVPGSSPVQNVFLTSGIVEPETVFCCP